MNLNGHGLQNLVPEADDNTNEPMLYQLSRNTEIPKYENTLPIHRNIYDIARMEVYELHLKVHELSPDCEFIGFKTYCLIYNSIKPTIHMYYMGRYETCDVPVIHQPSRIITYLYELNNNTWGTIEWDADNVYVNEESLKMDT